MFPCPSPNAPRQPLKSRIQMTGSKEISETANCDGPHAPPLNSAGRFGFAALKGWTAPMNFNAPNIRESSGPGKPSPAPFAYPGWLKTTVSAFLLLLLAIPVSGQQNSFQNRANSQVKTNQSVPAVPNKSQPAWRVPGTSSNSSGTNANSTQPAVANQDQLVLSQGVEFEKQGRWGEAFSLYNRAVKKHPSNEKLRKRRNIARLHFDLERRYSDSAYLKTLKGSSGTKSQQVYADVLAKIQSYYVDEPNWQSLVNHGAASLEIAIYDKTFRNKNIVRKVDANEMRQALISIRNTLKNFKVKSRQDAYVAASSISRTMNQQLGIPVQASIYEFISGTVVALDPYSSFMTGAQYSETMSQIEGNFVGLGVELKTSKESLDIVDVLKGGSAARSGLVGGDKIIAIEGKSVADIGSEVAADMLRGPENSYVILTIERKTGTKHRLQLQRRRVDIQSVEDVKLVDEENGIGYIRLTNFQKTTTRDFDAALWKLHRQGMRSLIVDVRDNPGGLLNASVDIANRFVSEGVIVSTRGRNPLEDFTHRAKLAGTWRVPLIVLIDENSASASEIFAAAISDNRRGTVIGQQSYGKGSVQGIFPLNVSGGGIRLTTAKFYSPKGVAISQRGVKPNIEVQSVLKPDTHRLRPSEDAILKTAMRVAKRNLGVTPSNN